MTFKIETSKWSWAEPVKNKNVYRNEEFVVSKTKEKSLDAIDFLMSQAEGNTYTITILRDKQYITYFRHSMPCLGGLAKYRDSHGEKYSMNPYFPRDISVAFPEGKIIYIACYRKDAKKALDFPYYDFLFSEESPWIAAFGKRDTIIFKDNYFVLTNMKADPTVFYSLMKLGGFHNHGYGGGVLSKTVNPKAELLASKYTVADPRRLAGQKPLKISGGTWKDGFGYTRPYNEAIFHTELPVKLKDFGKLPNNTYPKATAQKTDYFVTEMKNNFGLDVSKGIKVTDVGVEKTLLEAWDYFKEKAKDLEDEA